jgi:hexokinase
MHQKNCLSLRTDDEASNAAYTRALKCHIAQAISAVGNILSDSCSESFLSMEVKHSTNDDVPTLLTD